MHSWTYVSVLRLDWEKIHSHSLHHLFLCADILIRKLCPVYLVKESDGRADH